MVGNKAKAKFVAKTIPGDLNDETEATLLCTSLVLLHVTSPAPIHSYSFTAFYALFAGRKGCVRASHFTGSPSKHGRNVSNVA